MSPQDPELLTEQDDDVQPEVVKDLDVDEADRDDIRGGVSHGASHGPARAASGGLSHGASHGPARAAGAAQ